MKFLKLATVLAVIALGNTQATADVIGSDDNNDVPKPWFMKFVGKVRDGFSGMWPKGRANPGDDNSASPSAAQANSNLRADKSTTGASSDTPPSSLLNHPGLSAKAKSDTKANAKLTKKADAKSEPKTGAKSDAKTQKTEAKSSSGK